MFVVNYSSAANSQFGLRWRESNSGHNEENLQYEQKEAHDRSPVVAVDESDQWVSWPLSDPKKRMLPDHAQS